MKWIALALIIIGIGLILPSKSWGAYGEEGPPLYSIAGWLSLAGGAAWLGTLLFIGL